MAASFPTSIKTWTAVADNVDTISASHINGAYDEIIAVETALSTIASASLSASSTYIEVTGLNLAPNNLYRLYFDIYQTVDGSVFQVFNGNLTATNYWNNILHETTSQNLPFIAYISSGAGANASGYCDIEIDARGYIRSKNQYTNGLGSGFRVVNTAETSAFTVTSITSIRLYCEVTNGFLAGTTLKLVKIS